MLEPSIEGIDFIFDYIFNISNFVFHFYLLYYKCHKVNFKHSGSYIDSRDWVKYKKGTINTIDKKDKWFIESYNNLVKSFRSKRNPDWEGINYPLGKDN